MKVDTIHMMSDKEITRLEIMQKIADHWMSQKEAAEQLGISVRQVKRIWKAYRSQGAAGLISQKREKPYWRMRNW